MPDDTSNHEQRQPQSGEAHADQPMAVHRTGGPPVDPDVAAAEAPGAAGNGNGNGKPAAPVPLDDEGQATEEPDRLAAPVGNEEPPRLPFVVVGVGASAGGIEAFTEFLLATPSDTGMAFVLLMHLPPERESFMAEVLSKRTAMPVLEVEDQMVVRPDHVYVIRPGRTLTIQKGRLRLTDPLEKRGHGHPVDDFFRSLAAEQRERAVCVILSGMGSNGSVGAQAVKAVGGVCIAQDPETALYPSMPRHLIDQGDADYILRPRDIPAALLRFVGHPYVRDAADASSALATEQQDFADVMAVLRTRTRQDFTGYKRPTIYRRLQRRMGLNQLTRLGDYVRLLRNASDEVQALADDLLIHVTGFFRDPQAWETLRERVIEPMVTSRGADQPIRCWVTACSSGEEAYTLAILIAEAMDKFDKRVDVKVFATDMAERSLAHARAGTFPLGIESEVTLDRLDRFFDRDDATYRVKKELRDMVVFAPQNLLQDPPFSRLDVCTCRNLLIYLEAEQQRRVLYLLHFGLRDGGALLLGSSETVGSIDDMFEPLDKKWRIYRRIGRTRHGQVEFPIPRILAAAAAAERAGGAAAEVARQHPPRPSIAQLAERALLQRHTPAAVVIDRDLRIVYFHGPVDRYLTQPAGEPTRALLAMCRESVRAAVRSAVAAAMDGAGAGEARDGTVTTDDGVKRIWVHVAPLETRPSAAVGAVGINYLLVSFEEREEWPPAQLPPGVDGGAEEVMRLREELARLHDELQSTVEELQSSNEELKAANEEITSVNEELQSSNEELETSKEELQSLNEELTTVNTQLQAKNDELQATSSDLTSLLASTDIAVIFLDPRMGIRRFTPAARELLDLISSDLGRPISDLHRKFNDAALLEDARAVLEKLVPRYAEVRTDANGDGGGRWFLRRITPYRSADDRIDGVVVTFFDITERKRAETEAANAREYAESIVETLHEPLLVLDPTLRIKSANPAFFQQFGVRPADTIGQRIYDLGNGQWDIPSLRTALEDVLPADDAFNDYEVTHEFPGLGRRVMLLNGRRLDHVELILLGIRDVTDRYDAERKVRQSEERLQRVLNVEGVGILTFEESTGTLIAANEAFLQMTGYTREDVARRRLSWQSMTAPEYLDVTRQQLHRLAETGRIGPYEKECVRADGSRFWMLLAGASLGDGTIVEHCLDVTERKQVERRLRENEVRLRAMADVVPDLLWESDPTGRTIWCNQRCLDYTGQTAEQARGNGWLETVHPEERERTRAAFQRAIETGQPLRHEHRIRRGADGQYRWFLVQALPVRDSAGRIIRWFGSATDMHDQRMALESLREGEEKFRHVVEGASDFAMIVFDPANRITSWNAGAEQITGYTKEEAIGQPGSMIFTPDDRAAGAPEQEQAEARRSGRAQDERWHLRKDGTRFWGSGVLALLPGSEGEPPRGFVKVLRDETSRRHAEEVMLRAKDAAESANVMKDQFLATLSHELRTPLSAILIYAKLLQAALAKDPANREAVDAITRSAEAQRQLIDDLLDSARITSGKLHMERRETDLREVLREAIEAVAPAAEAKGVALEVKANESLPAWVDPGRIRQVIWNLLNNAVKFTPEGGRVEVALAAVGRGVEIQVSDTGQGIPREFLGHVFDPFRQADASITRTKGGLGLGLAISRHLIELHGGTIAAESAGAGKGATFTVRLPLPNLRRGRHDGGAAATAKPPRVDLAEPLPAPLSSVRVLLVEDDAETRQAVERLLISWGATVSTVADAPAARAALGLTAAEGGGHAATLPARFDVLLCDIGLPGEDGYDLIKVLRAAESAAGGDAPGMPAVAITAFVRDSDRDQALAAGFDRHVGKPAAPDDLLAALRQALGRA